MTQEDVDLDEALSPVTPENADRPAVGRLEDAWALCLSGGGYRAMLFHVGALWRLNEAGYLAKLGRVSSVSGGSITAGVLGMNWSRLRFNADGIGEGFGDAVVTPVRRLAGKTIDIGAVMRILMPGSVSEKIIEAYKENLFGETRLEALPESPRFVINATNLHSGALWRFTRDYVADYKVGVLRNSGIPIATAVAASSAFPPFLSPVRLQLDDRRFEPGDQPLHRPPFTTSPMLADGGIYDNLGLETVWKRCKTVFVSDGGGQMQPNGKQENDWLRQSLRVSTIVDNQVRALRKRQVMSSFATKVRHGAFWGIRTDIAEYGTGVALPCPLDLTRKLAAYPTRLAKVDGKTQERLINWGYGVTDAAIRRYHEPSLAQPKGFPYSGGVG